MERSFGHAEEKVQRGADCDAASSDLSFDRVVKIGTGCLPGCEYIVAELRDDLLKGEIFYSLREVQIIIEQWRKHYQTVRPRSSLNCGPPAPQTFA